MIRVLHLSSTRPDFQTQRCLEHLTHAVRQGLVATSRTIGPAGDYHNPPTAALAMRFWHREDFDVVHAWGNAALLAALAAGLRQIIYSPPPEIGPDCLSLLGMLRRRRICVVCPSDAVRRFYLNHDIAADRCRVIRPGVDFNFLASHSDRNLRSQLGFDDADYVILAPGESTRSSGHRTALWTVGILNTLDTRYRMLTWGPGPGAEPVRSLAKRLGQPNLFTSAQKRLGHPIEFESLASVADVALIAAGGTVATLPSFICLAAGLPIVAAASPLSAELFEDNRTALVVPSAIPRTLAQRLVDLRSNAALQAKLREASRSHARAHQTFSIARFLAQWQSLYQSIASSGNIKTSAQQAVDMIASGRP